MSEEEGYAVKRIEFGVLRLGVVTQHCDGPCPLIAIVNALLLRGAIALPAQATWVSHSSLVRLLTDYAYEINGVRKDACANVDANVAASIRVLSSQAMRRGIMVNPSLTDVTAFEFTPEIGVFDLFRLRPLHGWVCGPRDAAPLRDFFYARSYNQIQDSIARLQHDLDLVAGSTVTDEEDEIQPMPPPSRRRRSCRHGSPEQAALACAWFAQHATQLTPHGLRCLEHSVGENEISVLFRNNHFYTLIRHQRRLYTLMSAAAYLDAPRFVFQRLAVHGRDFLSFDGSFRSLSASKCAAAPAPRLNTAPGSAGEASRMRSGAEVREMRLQRERLRDSRAVASSTDAERSSRRRLKQEEIDRRYAKRVQAIYDARDATVAPNRPLTATVRNEPPAIADGCVIT